MRDCISPAGAHPLPNLPTLGIPLVQMTHLHSWITPSSLVLVLALIAGVVIFVVTFLGRLVLVVAEFSVLVSGAYYPSGCHILGIGLVSLLWGGVCRMRLAWLL